MISLETAKALKEAGLKWEPVLGDLFVADYDNGLGPTPVDVVKTNNFGEPGPEYMWLPRLDQLPAEIERRGYLWELSIDDVDKPPYALYLTTPTRNKKWFTAESAEEATAQALLWILNQK